MQKLEEMNELIGFRKRQQGLIILHKVIEYQNSIFFEIAFSAS